MAPLLIGKNLSLSFPTKRVFHETTVSMEDGERIGIVGRNGDGKSTLLRLLAGILQPDRGDVTKRSDATCGILHQHDELDPADTALAAATGKIAEHEWAADRRAREIIEVLLGDIAHTAAISTLSGGQRRRVDLARLLIGSWDILMLDEPTNHLDIQTISWLAEHLKSRWTQGSGALLVVTHDRWFLDEVCTSMWEVHDERVSPFEGGYSAYILQRVERDRLAALAEEKRQNLLRKELAWLSRGARARATKPKFHLKVAHELIADEPPPRNSLELKRAAVARLGKRVFDFYKVTTVLGGKTLLDEVEFLIGPGDRLAILGANGAGKTTLLRLLTGELSPTKGSIKIGTTVQMAYLSQQLDELEERAKWRVLEVLEEYKRGLEIEGKLVSSRQLLERLGFERAYFRAYVKDLSGGQKRRLQLLLTLLKEPNVLILDEPGNDFDTDMLTVLEDLLDTWPGTLVLVSHDRYLVERVADMQYALAGGKIRHLPGGVDEYLRLVRDEQATGAEGDVSTERSTPSDRTGKEDAEQEENSLKAKLSAGEAYEARKQLASTERRMATLETRIEERRTALHKADPTDYAALLTLQAELDELQSELDSLETDWLDLSEKLATYDG